MIDIAKRLNVVIVGYGISGRSVFSFLKNNGHNVFVYDDYCQDIPNRIVDIDWKKIDVVVKSPSVHIMPSNCHKIIKEANQIGIEVLSTFDIFRLYHPKARIIAITGTNGKSTTAALINHLLLESGFSVQLGGNIGIPYASLEEAEFYVFEMSSYELASSKYMNFEIASILNIEPDHLEFHETFENYVKAKHSALAHAKIKIISSKDTFTMQKYHNTPNTITIFESESSEKNICINGNTLIDNCVPIIDLARVTNLRGVHNHQNLLFAYVVCKNLGAQAKELAKHIESFKALPHRMQTVKKIKNVLFVNDSKATNPNSAAMALETFFGYKIFWIVGGISKKIDPFPIVAASLSCVQKIYLFGESSEEFCNIFANQKQTKKCQTLENATHLAYHDALKENGPSVVLLSPMCASFDQFKNFEERGETFVKIVSELT